MRQVTHVKLFSGEVIDLTTERPDGQLIIEGNVLYYAPHDHLQRSTAMYLAKQKIGQILASGFSLDELEQLQVPQDFIKFKLWCDHMNFKPSDAKALQRYYMYGYNK